MANIFQRLFGRKETEPVIPQEERGWLYDIGLGYNTNSSYSNSLAMKLSTAYACTNILSNSVALLPMKVVSYENGKKVEVDHPLNTILNLKPNQKYNKFNFFKALIESVILNGNGYAYINRDERLNVKSLELLNPAYVQPMPQEDGTVKYIVAGMPSAVDASNMIHIFQHCDEMYRGISLLKYADMALKGAYDKENHADKFFAGGGGLLGVLKASAPLTNDQKEQIARSWEKSVAKTAGGGVAILPQGLDFQSISVSPEDEQLLESREFDVVSLCRYFNVSPLKVYDYQHMSYNSLEQVSLSFMQDSVMPYTQLIEDELNRKVFKPSEIGKLYVAFDYSSMLRGDKKSEVEYYRALLTNAVCSINEVRDKLGFAPIDEEYANSHWMQISYATADAIAQGQYIKGQDQGQNQKVDNKVKEKSE